MSLRICISFAEKNVDDIKIYNYLQEKRSKSIFIKELIEKHMKNEQNEQKNKV